MSDTGIGARVKRKEDHRFITGKGRYTDDINLKHRDVRLFRALAPRPRHHQLDQCRQGEKAAGRHRRADRRGRGRRQDRRAHLRLDDPFEGRLAHERRARIRSCARARCAMWAITWRWSSPKPRTRQRRRRNSCRSATASCRRWSTAPMRATRASPSFTTPRPTTPSTSGRSATRRRPTRPSPRAAHVTRLDLVNNRLIPNAIEPRAAIGSYDAGLRPLHALHDQPESACGAARHLGISWASRRSTSCASSRPTSGGGFGSKIFIYAEEVVCLWASKRIGGRPVKWTAERTESFQADAHGRDHVTHGELALDSQGKITALRAHTHRQHGRLPLYLRKLPSRPTSTPRCFRVSTTSRPSTPRSTPSTPTPLRSTPIAAPGGRKRPMWSSGWSRRRRAR